MASVSAVLASAYEAYRHKRYESARTYLTGLVHPKAAHLLGMISRKQGRLFEAREHLEWAAQETEKQAEQDLEILVSLAQLYRELDESTLAETVFRRIIGTVGGPATSQHSARLGLASLLTAQSRVDEALQVLEPVPADDLTANKLRGRALLETGDLELAKEMLEKVFAANPTSGVLQSLAQVCWLAGKEQDFETLLMRASKQPGLGAAAVDIARSSNRLEWAWQLGLGVAADKENGVAFRTAMATLAVDRGDAQSAIALAGDVVRANPRYGPAVATVISAQLMLGSTDKAQMLIERMRAAEPQGQHWIGYELIAARQRGEDIAALTTALIGVYELPVPDGFETLEQFNAAFLATLSRLKGSKQQPLGQSLRGGTQTGRNLATLKDPVLHAYIKALRTPVARHVEKLGNSAANPCSARNTGSFAINDCWSVTLDRSGFHESHVHPEGWLSSAYYVSVPQTREPDNRAGWLKFGEPPFKLSTPQDALHWVEPRPGLLALFPSYLWHSTQPVAEGGTRVTAPFDVVPV